MTFRCIVWAAVSSAPQAGDDKASIPTQIENAQALIHRRGWQAVAPPLIVPGQSRSIDFLHEAVAEIDAMRDLVDTAKRGEIDLVICRDYDRLARTRTLLTQLSTYLSRCLVQIYAMDKPVEPVPVDDLARQRGLFSSATVEAFAGLEAEREVLRMAQRRFYGMNSAMASGKWKHSRLAYGYTRKIVRDGHEVTLETPQIVPQQAALVRRIARMCLDEGLGQIDIARQLNLEGLKSPRGAQWQGSTVSLILHNPFYAGYIVWGLKRRQSVYDADKQKFVRRAAWVPSYSALRDKLKRRPGLRDLLEHQDDLAQDDVVIVEGQHEPIRTLDEQFRIDDEIHKRWAMGGRAASTRGSRIRLFSGITKCAECGASLVVHVSKNRGGKTTRVYYRCASHVAGKECPNHKTVREEYIYNTLIDVLKELASTPNAIEDYLVDRHAADLTTLKEEEAATKRSLEALKGRRARWDAAYESEVINLEDYGQRLGKLAEEQTGLENRIAAIQQRMSAVSGAHDRARAIRKALENPPKLTDGNKKAIKLYFRRVLERIEIDASGKIVSITFCS